MPVRTHVREVESVSEIKRVIIQLERSETKVSRQTQDPQSTTFGISFNLKKSFKYIQYSYFNNNNSDNVSAERLLLLLQLNVILIIMNKTIDFVSSFTSNNNADNNYNNTNNVVAGQGRPHLDRLPDRQRAINYYS